jgi:serine protease AprX
MLIPGGFMTEDSLKTGGIRRWLTVFAAAGIAVPLMAVAPTQASEQEQQLLSVFGDDLAAVSAEVEAAGGTVLETYDVADALLVTLPEGVSAPDGAVVLPDSSMTFQSTDSDDTDSADTESEDIEVPENTYLETIGVPSGKDGEGVTVALIDTGVAATGELDVTEINVAEDPSANSDGLGHGTFLAGLIAGSGESSEGAYQGVAPGADILSVKVAAEDGSTSMSKVLAGIQAVSDAGKQDSTIKVVNLALNSGSPLPPWIDPLARGLENLWAQGLTVVVASGNDGAGEITSPASVPTLIATGSVEENKTADRSDDVLADFSSYGKAFGAMRPDFSAPGVSLVSLKSPGSAADLGNPDSAVGDKYFKGSGTSMSAAVVSGAVASLVAERPELGPDDVKRLLVGTSYDGLPQGAGAGGLDLAKAHSAELSQLPELPYRPKSSRYSPSEDDVDVWRAFGEAWASGDLRSVVAAWTELSPQTRKWAATSWSLAVLGRSLTMSDEDFEGRRWSGRRWSGQRWQGRRWSSDKWVGRRWSSVDWSSAKWNPETWDKLSWQGRRWSGRDWLAFAWTARNLSADPSIGDEWAANAQDWKYVGRRWSGRRWSTNDWAGRRWSEEAWSGRRWSDFVYSGRRWSDESWDGRRWSGRRWSDTAWIGRRWSDENWEGRRWSEAKWDGRRWSDEDWDGRRWSGRRWSEAEWDGRRWSGRRWSEAEWDGRRWSGRRWSTGEWTGRRWSEFTAEARIWATEDWSGRRWS